MYHSTSIRAQWNFPEMLQQGSAVLFTMMGAQCQLKHTFQDAAYSFQMSVTTSPSLVTMPSLVVILYMPHPCMGAGALRIRSTTVELRSWITTMSLLHYHKTSMPLKYSPFQLKVQLCNCSDPDLCNVTGQYQGKVTTYPGRTVRLNVTSVDDGNNLSPSVVYASIDTITLGTGQEAQWIGKACGAIEYQIYGPEMTSSSLTLFTSPSSFPTVIEVELLPCEPGFIFMANYSKCDCSSFLVSHGVVCDASDGTVTRNKPNWIGVYNNTLPALASICPLDYCNSTISKLSLGKSEDLCNGGRTGILCGQCHGNYSVIFGSSQCQVCSDICG